MVEQNVDKLTRLRRESSKACKAVCGSAVLDSDFGASMSQFDGKSRPSDDCANFIVR